MGLGWSTGLSFIMSSAQGHHVCWLFFGLVSSAIGSHGKEYVTNWRKSTHLTFEQFKLKCLHTACLQRNTNNNGSFQLPREGRINLIFLICIERKQKQVSGESELELRCFGFSGLNFFLQTTVFQDRKNGFQSTWWRSLQTSSVWISGQ